MNPMNATGGEDFTEAKALVQREPTARTFYVKSVGMATVLVEVHKEGVLYVHVGTHARVPTGAALVGTQGTHGGHPFVVMYRGIPEAGRGEGYASGYYEHALPGLREGRNASLGALEQLHDSDDGRDADLAARRDETLGQVAADHGDGGERRRRAAADAERGRQLVDRLGRRNPGAAAMANAWAALQLDAQLRTGTKAELRVSESFASVIGLVGSVWKAFHDADIQLASMERWWTPGRRNPLRAAQAKRLAARVAGAAEQVSLVHVAPYAQMPLVQTLSASLDELVAILEAGTALGSGYPALARARRILALLLIHPQLSMARTVAGMVRRFPRRPVTDAQSRRYLAHLKRAGEQLARAAEHEAVHGLERFLVDIRGRIDRAESAVLREAGFDASEACRQLDAAFAVYNRGVPAN